MNKQDFEVQDEIPEHIQEAIDTSTTISYEFIQNEIMPILDEFEHNNDEDEYVIGCASFILYTKIIAKLNNLGYSSEELHQLLDQYYDMSMNDTLH